jgi:hypothetical protein
LTVDPDLVETGQPFAYAGDDPVNDRDPMGLKQIKDKIDPCSNRQGGVVHFRSHVGDLQSEQSPVTGRVRFTLILNDTVRGFMGAAYPTISGSITAFTPQGKRLQPVHYSAHTEPSNYAFHVSIGAVPQGSIVRVTFTGSGGDVQSLTAKEPCLTILGPSE